MKFCTKCGAEIKDNIKFCTKCGALIESRNLKIEDNKNRNISMNNTRPVKIKENNAAKEARNYNSKKSNAGKVIMVISCVVVVLAGVLGGLFFNTIRSNYYMGKSNKSYTMSEKIDYAQKAVQCSDNNKTNEFLKQVYLSAADSDINLAEKKLKELSFIIDESKYKEIAIEVKNKKLQSLYSQGNYEDASRLFQDIADLGGDFKNNKYYEGIMLNVISKITGTSVADSKNELIENRNICFENFDDDKFDEILEIKNGQYYDKDIKINLYKYSDGQYKQIDTKLMNNLNYPVIDGIYNYAKDTKGVYLQYDNNDGDVGVGVFDVENGRVQLKGAVFSNNYTKPDDVNNDGIYELLSNSVNRYSYSSEGASKWYKINTDGSQPSELNESEKVSQSTKNKSQTTDISDLKNTDYMFPNSSNEYLSDDDLKDLSKEELAIARNEIFARYGYVFTKKEYADYFKSKSWYSENSDYDGNIERLNKYEKANVDLIKEWEEK